MGFRSRQPEPKRHVTRSSQYRRGPLEIDRLVSSRRRQMTGIDGLLELVRHAGLEMNDSNRRIARCVSDQEVAENRIKQEIWVLG